MSDDQGNASVPPETIEQARIVPLKLDEGTKWSRIARQAPGVFSKAAGNRFSDPRLPAGILYCGDSLETCFWEVFWDALSARDRYVCLPLAHLSERSAFSVWFKRTLRVFDATNPAQLKAVGASGVACFSGPYSTSRLWARRLHDCDARLDGILYASARSGSGRNLALFGDRVAPRGLGFSRKGVPLDKAPEIIDLLIREKIGLL